MEKNLQTQDNPQAGTSSSRPCPICGQSHSELIGILELQQIARIPNTELLTEWEYCKREVAQCRKDNDVSDYAQGMLYRLRQIEKELTRRSDLAKYGAGKLPSKGFCPPEIVEEIKQRANIVETLSRYVQVYAGDSDRRRYACPVHGDGNDEHPSGVIYRSEGRYWCFVCNAGGDCFTALMSFGLMTFRQAVESLAKQYSIPIQKPQLIKPEVKGVKIVRT